MHKDLKILLVDINVPILWFFFFFWRNNSLNLQVAYRTKKEKYLLFLNTTASLLKVCHNDNVFQLAQIRKQKKKKKRKWGKRRTNPETPNPCFDFSPQLTIGTQQPLFLTLSFSNTILLTTLSQALSTSILSFPISFCFHYYSSTTLGSSSILIDD